MDGFSVWLRQSKLFEFVIVLVGSFWRKTLVGNNGQRVLGGNFSVGNFWWKIFGGKFVVLNLWNLFGGTAIFDIYT